MRGVTHGQSELSKRGFSVKDAAFLGNDINDLGCLNDVGFPACVADSYPGLFKVSKYITKAKGGYGAVREFCDFIVKAKDERIR